MNKLAPYEKAFLESILKKEKEKAETFLENNSDSFEASFVQNETLPLIASILKKLGNTEEVMKKFELVLIKPNGKEEVIKRNLTEQQAIRYFQNIDNTYYREQTA